MAFWDHGVQQGKIELWSHGAIIMEIIGFIYPNGTNRKGKWLKEVPVCRVDTENFYVEDVQNSWSACCTQEEPRGFDSFGTVGFKQWWSLTEGE
ncbi:hypothetical protein IAQ61_009253 [Plenodomus lingam]|uniref:uncharacterized protein n=1 Tax=Leptosphaeria maculans TaxID=5022 RepID=UPI0033218100|nr:hypothetical protein IAQ61_009253 [Plenodomus lingam]